MNDMSGKELRTNLRDGVLPVDEVDWADFEAVSSVDALLELLEGALATVEVFRDHVKAANPHTIAPSLTEQAETIRATLRRYGRDA